MTRLTLIRHGETDWNLQRRIQGSTDIPLNDTGRQQARDAATSLREAPHPGLPMVIVSSDLSRARETAEIIAAEIGLAGPRVYPGLRERSYGEAEGLDIVALTERWGDWRSVDVPGMESWDDVRTRVFAALRAAIDDMHETVAPGEASLIVVTHGGVIGEMLRSASDGALPAPGERIANGSAHPLFFRDERVSLSAPVETVLPREP